MKHVFGEILRGLLMILFSPIIVPAVILKGILIFIVSGYEGLKKELQEGDF